MRTNVYVPEFDVRIKGKFVDPDIKQSIISINCDSNLDQAEMFQIVMENSGLQIDQSVLMELGQDVEIFMGYANNLQMMMMGEVVAINPSFPEGGVPTISVTGYDKSYRLRHNYKRRPFRSTNASAIATQIAKDNNMEIQVDSSTVTMNQKSQYGSDMAILKELARRNQFQVFVKGNTLHFQKPPEQEQPIVLEWGKNLLSLSLRLSTARQKGMIHIQDYDPDLAQNIEKLISINGNSPAGKDIMNRLGKDFMKKLESFGKQYISNESLSNHTDAGSYAESLLNELLQGLFEGNGACMGMGELSAGKTVNIRGVGKEFSGTYQLSQVSHSIDSGSGYRTSFQVAQRHGTSFLNYTRKIIQEEESPHRQQKIYTPIIATVKDTEDSKGLGRVRVRYPWLTKENEEENSVWAYLASPHSGLYFIPEKGDSVVVVFDKGDIDRPIIIGTIWNVKNKPPEKNSEKKIIKTPTGAQIEFDDKGGIKLVSAGGATIKLDGASNRIDLNP